MERWHGAHYAAAPKRTRRLSRAAAGAKPRPKREQRCRECGWGRCPQPCPCHRVWQVHRPTALGIGIGGLGYFLIVSLLERSGNSEKAAVVIEKADERADHEVEGASPTEARNLLIGMVVDGVPESVSIGLTLHLGSIGVSAALVGSVFIAGLPEAIGVAAALLAGGFTLSKILARFSVIVLIGSVAGAIGYGSLVNAPHDLIAIIQAIAAGALLVVVVNEMIPIAVRGAKRWAGVLAACGFVFAAGMTWITG